jgi:hypothetical protein
MTPQVVKNRYSKVLSAGGMRIVPTRETCIHNFVRPLTNGTDANVGTRQTSRHTSVSLVGRRTPSVRAGAILSVHKSIPLWGRIVDCTAFLVIVGLLQLERLRLLITTPIKATLGGRRLGMVMKRSAHAGRSLSEAVDTELHSDIEIAKCNHASSRI